ncbi:hypothetical protein FN846DRAFT_911590 [Sphaerosporella brunnea]|uniref:Uncharacterized protein n=1 Tax=Sphaerosporella brunnea TaxID=1250544 RepID=A0A5J5EK86_9PEZI|nr:hypothetical protein FN846DRAFT_911590 [Sphaerosporella brunnea]
MSMRLTESIAGAARLQPSASTLPKISAVAALSILDALPGDCLVSKTAIVSSVAGLSIAAISNERYVVNEETVVAFCPLSVFTAIGKYLRLPITAYGPYG